MNLKAYLESGVLECYALGLLTPAERAEAECMMQAYPELREELNRIEESLESYSRQHAVQPPAYLRSQTVELMDNLDREKRLDPGDLPLINRFSSHKNWLQLVAPHLPLRPQNGRAVKVLQHNPQLTQLLLVSDQDFEEEVHEDLYESFLILKGNCLCTVGGRERLMQAGDYMEIPLFQPHRVILLEPGVTAILQRIPL